MEHSELLTYVSNAGMTEHLNDKMLAPKMTMFIALTFSIRAHELCSLNIDFLMKLLTHTFHFSKITKTARHGELRLSLELTNFSGKNLCVCHHIDVYLERIKAWRKTKGHLLLSFINPNKFLTTQAVSR